MFLLAMTLFAGAVPQPIRLATYAYPRYDRAQALQPLKALIEAQLQRPVTVQLFASPNALRDAIRAGQVDVAMTNLASYIGMAGTRRLEAVAVLDVPAATLDRYRGVLLARKAGGTALVPGREAGIRYAEVLPGSTSGALVQRAYLRGVGIDSDRFAARFQAGTHESALAALVEDRADLAALAEEPWRNAPPALRARLVELWRSPPLPPGPLVCVGRVGFSCSAVKRALRQPSAASAATALARGWSETDGAVRFRAIKRNEYSAFLPR